MARGILYELQEDLEDVGTTSESDFFEYLGHEFSHIAESVDSNGEIELLLAYLRELGAETGVVADGTNGRGVPYVEITDNVKKAYFQECYNQFTELLKKLTIDQFINDGYAYKLRNAIDDEYGDAVTNINDEFRTLDYFMRNASGRYYVGKVFIIY